MTDFSLEVVDVSGSIRLVLRGELDAASAPAANRALLELLEGGSDRVVLDLTELDFIDSMGVKFLIDGRDAAHRLGVALALAYGEGVVERVLTVSGVASLFERQDGDATTGSA
jgi:anti-sigma B factor antagonist